MHASASAALCLAGGSGHWSRRAKRHFYTMALGSARECAAVLDLAARRGMIRGREADELIARVIRATEGLVHAMDRR